MCQRGIQWTKLSNRKHCSLVRNAAKEKVEQDITFFKVEDIRLYELLPGGEMWYVEVVCQHVDDPDGEKVTLLCQVTYDPESDSLSAKQINSLLDV